MNAGRLAASRFSRLPRCLQEHGLEAVSMEMIIARSGLSTGAVYGYFKGKDQIISAVVTDGTAAMAEDLARS